MESDNILAEANQRENCNLKFSKKATVGEDIRYQRILSEKRFDQEDETSSKDKEMVRCSRCVQRGISLQWTSSS